MFVQSILVLVKISSRSTPVCRMLNKKQIRHTNHFWRFPGIWWAQPKKWKYEHRFLWLSPCPCSCVTFLIENENNLSIFSVRIDWLNSLSLPISLGARPHSLDHRVGSRAVYQCPHFSHFILIELFRRLAQQQQRRKCNFFSLCALLQ